MDTFWGLNSLLDLIVIAGVMWKSVLSLQGYTVWDFLPEPWACVSPELLSEVHPQKSTLWSFHSFHKDSHVIQNRGHRPIRHISEVKEEDSGLYQCMVATKDDLIQKQSQQLEI